MIRPIAVLISDVHYDLSTLSVADNAMRQAIDKSNSLEVPLIVAGDLHNSKAQMRAECVNAMLATFAEAHTPVFILRGNHDSINERSDVSALAFLERWPVEDEYNSISPITVVDSPRFINDVALNGRSLQLIPYQHDTEAFKACVGQIDKGSLLIVHQGLKEALPGEYIQDKSAVSLKDVVGYRVASGHYHARQTIENWSYLGNPYSLSFGEASDPPKGFSMLMSDGSLEFVPTNLRKHVVVELKPDGSQWHLTESARPVDGDLVWVKVRASALRLSQIEKEELGVQLGIPGPFRLDLIPDIVETTAEQEQVDSLPQGELLDAMIDSLPNDNTEKNRLKTLWKELK